VEDQHNQSLGFLLNDLSHIMRKRFDRRARELDLTRAQWRVLSRLRYRQGINQSTLADLLEIEPITLARHIDRLEEKGWVERRDDPNDRRAWLLYLDDSVQPILGKMQEISDWNRDDAFVDFDATEQQQFIETLKRMKDNLVAAERSDAKALLSEQETPPRRVATGG
jgi:MarR family transcriptional regulator, transcriptional regulator for hemolysin